MGALYGALDVELCLEVDGYATSLALCNPTELGVLLPNGSIPTLRLRLNESGDNRSHDKDNPHPSSASAGNP